MRPATSPAIAGTACDTKAISGTAWVSGSAASSGQRGHGAQRDAVHRDERAGADEEARARRRGPGRRPPRSGSSSSPRPSRPSAPGGRAAQGAGQGRVPVRVGRQRDRDDGGAQGQRGEQAGQHAAQQRARGAGQPVQCRVEQPRLPAHAPSRRRRRRGRRHRDGPEQPDVGARVVDGRARSTTVSSTCTATTSPAAARRVRARGQVVQPRRAPGRPATVPRRCRGSAAAAPARAVPPPTSSSPPWASSHSRPASAMRGAGAEPAGGVQRLDDDERQPEPGQPGQVDRDRRGHARARASGSGGLSGSAPPGQACEQGDHATHARKRRAPDGRRTRRDTGKRAGSPPGAPPRRATSDPAPGVGCRAGGRQVVGSAARGTVRARALTRGGRPPPGGRRRAPGGGPAGRRTAGRPAGEPAPAADRRAAAAAARTAAAAAGRTAGRAGRGRGPGRPGAGRLAARAGWPTAPRSASPPGSAGLVAQLRQQREDGEHQDRRRRQHAEQRPDGEVDVERVDPGEQREHEAQRGQADGDPGAREARASGR